jgi:hypothetical protein
MVFSWHDNKSVTGTVFFFFLRMNCKRMSAATATITITTAAVVKRGREMKRREHCRVPKEADHHRYRYSKIRLPESISHR